MNALRDIKRGALSALGAACLALCAACSTAPKNAGVIYETKNKAVDFSRLGDGFMATGQYDQAMSYYGQALQASRSVDDLEGISSIQASMGKAYANAGMPAEARAAYEASLERARMAASAPAEAVALTGLGELDYAEGKREEALERFNKALDRLAPEGKTPKAKEKATQKAFAIALHDRAVARVAMGQAGEARADLERAAEINEKAKRWVELAANRYVLASMLSSEGKLEEALAMALSALEADKTAENGHGIAGDLAAAGRLAQRLGRDEEAFGYWKRSFDAALAIDDARATRAALASLPALASKLKRPGEEKRYAALLVQLDEAEKAEDSPAASSP
jgi:tetratricopeptide (TPR) repeat protein